LAHTINGFAFARVTLNGMELGEAGIYGALAGEHGVPVAIGTGDDVFISENRSLFPTTQWVETKVARGQGTGVTLSPALSRDRIQIGVQNALSNLSGCKPFVIAPPIECVLQTQSSALADLFCLWPALERVDGNLVRFNAASMGDAVRMLNSLAAMSFMLR
jgi:D-amino peptidase